MSGTPPRRIQLRRTKGWRKPPGCIVCARPGRWGNPITVQGSITPELAVRMHREQTEAQLTAHPITTRKALSELRGHDLACWCRLCPAHAAGKPLGLTCDDCAPCHADTLLELANA